MKEMCGIHSQAIIQQRLRVNQDLHKAHTKRQKLQAMLQLQGAFPSLTEQEVRLALQRCNGNVPETRTLLSEDDTFIRQIRKDIALACSRSCGGSESPSSSPPCDAEEGSRCSSTILGATGRRSLVTSNSSQSLLPSATSSTCSTASSTSSTSSSGSPPPSLSCASPTTRANPGASPHGASDLNIPSAATCSHRGEEDSGSSAKCGSGFGNGFPSEKHHYEESESGWNEVSWSTPHQASTDVDTLSCTLTQSSRTGSTEVREKEEYCRGKKEYHLSVFDSKPDMRTWSDAQRKAWEQREGNPNAYYYRFLDPGQRKNNGDWTDEERRLFFDRLKDFSGIPKWGLFSMAIPSRVGYQCSNFYRNLIKRGVIKDPHYSMDSKGKLAFKRPIAEKRLTKRDSCGQALRASGTRKQKGRSGRSLGRKLSEAGVGGGRRRRGRPRRRQLSSDEESSDKTSSEDQSWDNRSDTDAFSDAEQPEWGDDDGDPTGTSHGQRETVGKKMKGVNDSECGGGDEDDERLFSSEGDSLCSYGEEEDDSTDTSSWVGARRSSGATGARRQRVGRKPSSRNRCDRGSRTKASSNSCAAFLQQLQSLDDSTGASQVRGPLRAAAHMRSQVVGSPVPENERFTEFCKTFLDPVTLDYLLQPAISPQGFVMDYATWLNTLQNSDPRNTCPFTKLKVTKRELVILSHENFHLYEDHIANRGSSSTNWPS